MRVRQNPVITFHVNCDTPSEHEDLKEWIIDNGLLDMSVGRWVNDSHFLYESYETGSNIEIWLYCDHDGLLHGSAWDIGIINHNKAMLFKLRWCN